MRPRSRIPARDTGQAMLMEAFIDSSATNVTRPPQLYLSQALIGFGTTLFVGPAILYGFLQIIQKGPKYLVSLVVLFSITQNVGALVGSACAGEALRWSGHSNDRH
jgi:hypothetical protein